MPSRSIPGWTAAAGIAIAFAAAVGCGSSDGGVTDVVDAGGPEADPPLEASTPDAPVDAGVDAADTRPEAAPPGTGFCAGLAKAPRFCDDFDNLDFETKWDFLTVLPQSVAALDDAAFTSAPVSFVALTKAIPAAGGVAGNVSIRKTVLGSVSHATLTFSARFSETTITKGLLAIATLDVSMNHFFTLYLRDDDAAPAAALVEQMPSTQTRHVLTGLPLKALWTKIVIDIDLAGGKANVTFGNDKVLVDAPINGTLGTEATIRLGAVYLFPPAGPLTLNFDDVVLDF